ncbi:MAG: hypothetical protein DCC58_01895 [Chloroflexi bacterium]|nr:MAG: hypothetical protein DCC58_01895 [Chloroflexota bacterium]
MLIARLTVWVVAISVIVTSVVTLGLFVAFEDKAERYTAGRQPTLYYAAVGDVLLDDYSHVFGVAHNSGDSLSATMRAFQYGADVIEIDVLEYNGVLYAAHNAPLPRVGGQVFRGPRLDDAWAMASRAEVVKLDLKQTTPSFTARLIQFLNAHQEQKTIVTTGDEATLRAIAEGAPHVFRLLSIASAERFAALQSDEALLAVIDGVTIQHTLLNAETAAWLNDQSLTILAWTVNDIERVNELVTLGVDAITTDNLAILELLGGFRRDEALLERAANRRAGVH